MFEQNILTGIIICLIGTLNIPFALMKLPASWVNWIAMGIWFGFGIAKMTL